MKKQIEVERIRQVMEQPKLDLEGHRLAQEAYSSLSAEDSSGYVIIKSAVLKA